MVSEGIVIAVIGTIGLIVVAMVNARHKKTDTKLEEVKGAIDGKIDSLIQVNRAQAALEERLKHERDSIKSVFILDDDLEDLNYLCKIVDDMDPVKCFKFIDPFEFLTQLTNKKAIYIIDDNLGSSSGLSVVEEVKKRNINNFVILCTGNTDPILISKYVNLGVKRILIKGIQISKEDFIKFVLDGVESISIVEIN